MRTLSLAVFLKQHDVNGGRCGVCGDSWELQPRPHEVGGLYATGIIVRNYSTGQVIEVRLQELQHGP
ncbi:hypothetical protein HAZT_HAZT003907, partial [Hyalella azteca]